MEPTNTEFRAIDILLGKKQPTTWSDLKAIGGLEELRRHTRGNSVFVHALRCYFASGNDMSFCVHYIPKVDPANAPANPHLIEQRQPYRGELEMEPTAENVWKTCGAISSVTPTHLYILDRSQKNSKLICSEPHDEFGDPPRDHYSKKLQPGDPCMRKKGCPGRLVKHESWSTKALIIPNIINVTDAAGSPIDFSRVLAKHPGFDLSQMASLERIQRMKDQKEEHRQNLIKENLPGSQDLNLDRPADGNEGPHVEAALTPEDRKQQVDYWSYYDPNYAKQMVKDKG